ncbi:MAG TPA: hypothetical protein VK921_11170, partial [Anditalea sp.]|nr:hypothetical protein [Anditalea sp.]
MIRVFLVAVIFSITFFGTIESYGQCADCTVTVIGDNIPGEIVNGSVVCLLGTRITPLDLLGRTNI